MPAMDEADGMTPGQIANHTFAYLRRIEKQLNTVTEVLLRHETRLGRIERDVGEVKSDIILLENQLLSRMNEILGVVRKVDEQEERLPIWNRQERRTIEPLDRRTMK